MRGICLSETNKKKVERDSFKVRLLGWLLSLLLRLLFYTSRKTYSELENLSQFFDSGKPVILVAWHNRNILSSFGYLSQRPKGRRWFPMASASKDGSYATNAMSHLGITCIRGSSSRRGMQALREMLRTAKAGHDLGITPDGPRGPVYKVQEGVITTARLSGLPIVPMTYQAKRKKVLNSWDSMIVPFPFNHLHYVYGKPFHVPRDADEETQESIRLEVEAEMMRICEVAERF